MDLDVLDFVLFLLSLLCFLVASFSGYRPSPSGDPYFRGINLVALGLGFWMLDLFIHAAQALN